MWALPGPRGATHVRVMLWLEADRMSGAEGGPGRAEGRGCQSAEAEANTSSWEVVLGERAWGNLGAQEYSYLLKWFRAGSAFFLGTILAPLGQR